MKTMGTRIRAKREECGMTQDDLAKKLNISRQAIAKYESGEVKRINRDLINKMALIFGCQPAWLMNLDDARNVTLTYHAPGKEPIVTAVKGSPIIGVESLRAQLYHAAVGVKPENLQVAIELLKSLS